MRRLVPPHELHWSGAGGGGLPARARTAPSHPPNGTKTGRQPLPPLCSRSSRSRASWSATDVRPTHVTRPHAAASPARATTSSRPLAGRPSVPFQAAKSNFYHSPRAPLTCGAATTREPACRREGSGPPVREIYESPRRRFRDCGPASFRPFLPTQINY